ncbi:hypothetical protein ACIGH6_16980 [Brachybacterium paraconglomeratum]|uniref:hypothetical protein n=1 Tax=Brachybacterium TaxID=43668 RepID=UPI0032426F49
MDLVLVGPLRHQLPQRRRETGERRDPFELALVDAAVDGWGEHAYAPGIFGAPVDVPGGADAQTRVLARTGRRG